MWTRRVAAVAILFIAANRIVSRSIFARNLTIDNRFPDFTRTQTEESQLMMFQVIHAYRHISLPAYSPEMIARAFHRSQIDLAPENAMGRTIVFVHRGKEARKLAFLLRQLEVSVELVTRWIVPMKSSGASNRGRPKYWSSMMWSC